MKDGRFETQAEIYQALLNGKKIRYFGWHNRSYIELKVGGVQDDIGERGVYNFKYPQEWELYKEPRETIDVYESCYSYIPINCTKDGLVVYLLDKKIEASYPKEFLKQNIITPNKPKFKIYADTFEIVREGEDETE